MSDESNEHELFPAKSDDDDAPEVETIHVSRLQGGQYVFARRAFGAEELPNLDALFENFGGGSYELIARARGRVSARRKHVLDGKPRPLNPEPAEEHEPRMQPAQTAPAGAPAWLSVVAALAPLLMQYLQMQSASSQAAQRTQTELLLGLMNQGAERGREHVETMTSMHNAFAQTQSQLFAQMIERLQQHGGGGGAGDGEGFMGGVEWMGEFMRSQLENREGGDAGETELIQSMLQFLSAGKVAAEQRATPPNGAPPNGAAEQ